MRARRRQANTQLLIECKHCCAALAPAAGAAVFADVAALLHSLVVLVVPNEAMPVLVGGGETRVIGSSHHLQPDTDRVSCCCATVAA